MPKPTKTKRPYRLITPEVIAMHRTVKLQEGNGTRAVQVTDDDEYLAPHQRSYRIIKKSEEQSTPDYIEDALQQIGAEAVQELGELVHSSDEKIRTKNVHYAIDHIRGKAVQKSESRSINLTIEAILD